MAGAEKDRFIAANDRDRAYAEKTFVGAPVLSRPDWGSEDRG